MYKSIIDIQKEIPQNVLIYLISVADRAFDNRAGKAKNSSDSPYRLIYEGGEQERNCLEIGLLTLRRDKSFLQYVTSWEWVDADPRENCNVLEEFAAVAAMG